MSTEQQIAWRVAEVASEKPLAMEPTPTTGVALALSRLRIWGPKSALALLDQGLTSGVGFVVNLLLARWMVPGVYGAFAVTFAAYLFLSGFHNVLLLEPMTVLGPSRHTDKLRQYFRMQIKLHVILVGGLSGLTLLGYLILLQAAPGSLLNSAVLGAGLALPFLLLSWLVRRMCYVVQQPSTAALGSGSYLLFVLAGLFLLRTFGHLGPLTAFLLMGLGSIFTALFLLWRLGLLEPVAQGEWHTSWLAVFLENWAYGRWLLGSALLYSISSQMQMFLVAGILGLGTAGILRAMQLPSLVMTQVITATGLLFLPILSGDFGGRRIVHLRHKATVINAGLSLIALSFAAALVLCSHRSEHLLFGGKYSTFAWLMPLLALVPVASATSTGYSMALRASGRPHFDLFSNIIAAPVSVISAFLFIRWWGVAGAAASMVLSFAVISVITAVCFRRSKWDNE